MQHILAEVPEAREAASARDLMHATLNTFISSMHQDWYNSISTNLLATLNQNLLAQVTSALHNSGTVRPSSAFASLYNKNFVDAWFLNGHMSFNDHLRAFISSDLRVAGLRR